MSSPYTYCEACQSNDPCFHNAVTGWCATLNRHEECEQNGGHVNGKGAMPTEAQRRPCTCECHIQVTDEEVTAAVFGALRLAVSLENDS